jgi:hypothetical protein
MKGPHRVAPLGRYTALSRTTMKSAANADPFASPPSRSSNRGRSRPTTLTQPQVSSRGAVPNLPTRDTVVTVRQSRYPRQLVLAGAAGVALLAVTALGTRGSSTRGDEAGAGHDLAYLLVGAIAAVVLLVGLTARSERSWSRLARFALQVAALFVPIAVLGLLAAAALHEQRQRRGGAGTRPVPAQAVPSRTATPPPLETSTPVPARDGSGGPSLWVPLLALGLISGVAVVMLTRRARPAAVSLRRRREAAEAEEEAPAALRDPAEIADPRAAIIAAFACLEAELGAAGSGRRRGEGPIEYTERVAAARPELAPPVRRLARAYAPARFSEHRVGATMRRDALVALDAVRHALAPAVAPSGGDDPSPGSAAGGDGPSPGSASGGDAPSSERPT